MLATYIVGVMVVCCALVEARPRQYAGLCQRKNEYFYSCGSACKDKRCEEDPRRRYCPAVCVPGCYCKPGYARDSLGRCIPEDLCPGPRCTGQNEYYTRCGSGCGDRKCDQTRPPLICPTVCIKGCFCKPGYARDAMKRCVPVEQCPKPSCKGENEQYTECGSSCKELKCGQDQIRACPEICMKGCFCKPGYARDAMKRCVPVEQCPKPSCKGENEQYTECGSSCKELKCGQDPIRACPEICMKGCFCKPGYARDTTGRCVPVGQCPQRECKGKNEHYTECGSGCGDLKCGQNKERFCPAVCREGCFCNPGYARDAMGRCIPENQCPKQECKGKNEHYTECGSGCGDLKCNNKNIRVICPAVCRKGCFCKPGHVRDTSGACIPKEDCTRRG